MNYKIQKKKMVDHYIDINMSDDMEEKFKFDGNRAEGIHL